jgi:hypothetical protein
LVIPYGQLQKWFPDLETIFNFIYITIVKITGDGFKSLDEGQLVQFDVVKGQRGSHSENVSKEVEGRFFCF